MSKTPRAGRKVSLGLVVVGVVLVAVAAGFLGGGVTNAASNLIVKQVRLKSLYRDAQGGGLGLKLSVEVSNPTNTPVSLENIKYFVGVEGAEAVDVNGPSTLSLPPRESKIVVITGKLDTSNNETAQAVQNMLTTREAVIGVGMVAEVPVKWFGVVKYSSVTVELSGNTTQDISSVLGLKKSAGSGSMVTLGSPDLGVIEVNWYSDPNKEPVTQVGQGDVVYLKFTIKAYRDLHDYDVRAMVLYDIAHAVDKMLGYRDYTLNMKAGEEKTFLVAFYASDIRSNVRGLYFSLGLIGLSGDGFETVTKTLYEMPNHYPPRLRVVGPPPHLEVSSVKWYANGHEVTKVGKNTWVEARITLKAITNAHDVKVEYCVRADYKFVIDKTIKCGHTTVYLNKGQEKTVTIGFKAEKHWLLRGYFVKVYIWQWDKTTWEMPSHYPPRLKVG